MGKNKTTPETAIEGYYSPFRMPDDLLNRGARNDGQQAVLLNQQSFNYHLQTLFNITISRFKWYGLEDTGIDARYIELTLCDFGLGCFHGISADRLIFARAQFANITDIYGNPNAYTLTFPNNKAPLTIGKDGVIPLWNNYGRMPTRPYLRLFAYRLSQLDRSVDTAILRAKLPYILAVDPDMRASVKGVIEQVMENQPVVAVNGSSGGGGLGLSMRDQLMPIDMSTEYQGGKLLDSKATIMNELYTFLGINNANTDKRERLVSDEVSANDSQVISQREAALLTREQAAEELNDRFGMNVRVEWNGNVGDDFTYGDSDSSAEDEVSNGDDRGLSY